MKRSEINKAIKEMEQLIQKVHFKTPGFVDWTPDDWKEKNSEYDEIRDNMLGWDVTDYGMGKFEKLGLTLITIRNGNPKNPKYKKTYCEKLVMLKEGQVAPMHYHWNKMEDIVNRGGGNALVQLYNVADDNSVSDKEVLISTDGRNYYIKAGEKICLHPGESMSMLPHTYHEITVEEESGSVLLGEVSMCNDDIDDNYFLEKIGRFPEIQEDEPAYRLLCNEYPHV